MQTIRIEVELEVQGAPLDDPEVRKDVLYLVKRRAYFEGYTRDMVPVAATPLSVREVPCE